MQFMKSPIKEGEHALFSCSQYHWLNYDTHKVIEKIAAVNATRQGTLLHEFAEQAIKYGYKLQKSNATLNRFVNDAIGFKLTPEVGLWYSPYIFGTADAIGLKGNVLRISDLKTGKSKTSFEQLYLYAAIFCLQYSYSPYDLDFILRIYQNDDIREDVPEPQIIRNVMDKIIEVNALCMEYMNKED